MHDFGVSRAYTVILDLPLSLDPLNLAKNQPVVAYNPSGRSRFGVFPRYNSQEVRWFQTDACCIFHTANTWDDVVSIDGEQVTTGVNMLACRLTSASLVFSAGDLAAPLPTHSCAEKEGEQCRLYYYDFSLEDSHNTIRHQWALSAIPFEFPSVRDDASMSSARYIYGCSVSDSSFGAALGRAVKIDSLVKVDVQTLIAQGKRKPPTPVTGCVDMRNVSEVIASRDPQDPIKVFKMPEGWYAQESRFVAREKGETEDDGWLLSYVFDESQLKENGECRSNARSELWIIDARNMKDVIARIYLPQRVSYGLHGNWFSETDVRGQRPYERIRSLPASSSQGKHVAAGLLGRSGPLWKTWIRTRRYLEELLG